MSTDIKGQSSPGRTDGARDSDGVFYDTLEENSSDTESANYDSEVFNSPARSPNECGTEFWKDASYDSSKKAHSYLTRLSEKFHRRAKTPDDYLSASDGFLSPNSYFHGNKATRSLTPSPVRSLNRRVSTPPVASGNWVSSRLHSKRNHTENTALSRRSALDPMPVSIFISGALEDNELSSGGLKSNSRFYGSTGNILDMTDGQEKTNLTKRHLGKSLQLVSVALLGFNSG